MKPIEVIHQLKKAKTVKQKEAILEEQFADKNYELFQGLQLCFDPFFNLNIDCPKILDEDDEPDDLGMERFVTQITSDKFDIDDMLDISSVDAWNNWYRPIVMKNISVIKPLHINRVLSKLESKHTIAIKYKIPEFGFQKAIEYKKESLIGVMYVDQYIKGQRILSIIQDDVICYDQNGKSINIEQKDFLSNLKYKSIVFDGVLSNGMYWLFDIIPLDDYKKGYTHRTQEERHNALCEMYDELVNDNIAILPKKKVNFLTDDIDKIKRDFKEEGISSIVIKDVSSPYLFRKSTNWLIMPLDK